MQGRRTRFKTSDYDILLPRWLCIIMSPNDQLKIHFIHPYCFDVIGN